jgi:RNA polymerase sigma-70 factor, ECF subfamily
MQEGRLESFEVFVVPHMAAAYNLARWLTRNDRDAENVVQEAYLRAYRFYGAYHGGDFRAWLLTNCAQYLLHLAPAESQTIRRAE